MSKLREQTIVEALSRRHGRKDGYRIPDRRIPDRRIPDIRIPDRRIPDKRIHELIWF